MHLHSRNGHILTCYSLLLWRTPKTVLIPWFPKHLMMSMLAVVQETWHGSQRWQSKKDTLLSCVSLSTMQPKRPFGTWGKLRLTIRLLQSHHSWEECPRWDGNGGQSLLIYLYMQTKQMTLPGSLIKLLITTWQKIRCSHQWTPLARYDLQIILDCCAG